MMVTSDTAETETRLGLEFQDEPRHSVSTIERDHTFSLDHLDETDFEISVSLVKIQINKSLYFEIE